LIRLCRTAGSYAYNVFCVGLLKHVLILTLKSYKTPDFRSYKSCDSCSSTSWRCRQHPNTSIASRTTNTWSLQKEKKKSDLRLNFPRLELRRRSKSLRARLTFRYSPRKILPVGTVSTFVRFLSVLYLPSTCSLIHNHVAFLTFHLCLASGYIYYS
jgi:hypothetical protein